jgi:hypothetical protein
MQASIARRAFAGVGPIGAPVRLVHDAMVDATYTAVRAGLRSGPIVVAGAIARTPAAAGGPLADSTAGGLAVAALNGGFGDLLEREVPELATTMTIRHRGRALSLRTEALEAAHPSATGRIAVFVHGLVETERAWRFGAARHHGNPHVNYGSLLRHDLGYTPVWVRYNTGRRISDNGRDLDALIQALVEAWPVPVDELALIGHSMGGLVIRSALHESDGASWPGLVRATVTLGSPHLGAPAEKATNVATYALNRIGETRPLGALLALRSVGIKDLRYGNLAEVDWDGHDPDGLLTDTRIDIPLRDGVRHFAVVATLAGRHDTPAGSLLGDLLVRPLSAAGDTRKENRLAFPAEHVARLSGLHHFDLLNHPRVYARLRGWLAELPA